MDHRKLIALAVFAVAAWAQQGVFPPASGGGSGDTGSGTSNTLTKFTGSTTLGNSAITDNGTLTTLGEITSLGANALMDQYANANPGTVVNTLTKINSSRQAVEIATTDAINIYGICLNGCGNSGNAQVAFAGQAACLFDGQTTVNDFVTASTTTAGDCHDGTNSEPTGVQVIGRVVTANSGAGTTAVVALYSPDTVNAVPTIPALTVNNAGTTGTTLNKLAKLTGAPSTAVITATTDTQGAIGPVSAGAGTSGAATIVQNGSASCVFDGATTAGDYVQISSSTAGDCHDAGSTFPTSGEVIGRVTSTNGAAGTYTVILGTPDVTAISASTSCPPYWCIGSNKYVAASGYQATLPGTLTYINSVTPTFSQAGTNGDLVIGGASQNVFSSATATTSIEGEFSVLSLQTLDPTSTSNGAGGICLWDSTNSKLWCLNVGIVVWGSTNYVTAEVGLDSWTYTGSGNPTSGTQIFALPITSNIDVHLKLAVASGTMTPYVSLNGGNVFFPISAWAESVGTISKGGINYQNAMMDIFSVVLQ